MKVETLTLYWVTADGKRQGEKHFSGTHSHAMQQAKSHETKLLNLGFYTQVLPAREVICLD